MAGSVTTEQRVVTRKMAGGEESRGDNSLRVVKSEAMEPPGLGARDGFSDVVTRRPAQLHSTAQSPIHHPDRHHGLQVRIQRRRQGAALCPLPVLIPERRHTVQSLFPPPSSIGKATTLIGPPRNFLLRAYPTMKKHNPHTPILIREAQNVEPKVYARYGASQRPRLGYGAALADGNNRVRKGEDVAIVR